MPAYLPLNSEPCVGELLPGQVAYELEPVDPAVYVAATEVDTGSTHALVTDGGAWVHAFLRDDDGRVCDSRWGDRCFPGPFVYAVGSADPACSMPAVIDPQSCDVPVYASDIYGELRVVTEELETVFVNGADGCTPDEKPGYATGEAVDLDTLASLLRTHEGTGPVRVRQFRRAEEGTAVQDILWDTETELRCKLIWRGGALACERYRGLPGPSDTFFDDPSCTEPVYRTHDFSFAVAVPSPECGNHDAYVPHDSELSSYPDYELTDSGECVQAYDIATHYVPGEALPDDGYFVPLQRRVQ